MRWERRCPTPYLRRDRPCLLKVLTPSLILDFRLGFSQHPS